MDVWKTGLSSVIGPTLRNLFYDDLLRQPISHVVHLVGFEDDEALVVVAHNADLIEEAANTALAGIDEWMTNHDLRHALKKTEGIYFTRKWSFRLPKFELNKHRLPIKKSFRMVMNKSAGS